MLIGVSGKARAGKDTLFAIAMRDGFIRLSFADDLKDRARRDFGLTYEHTDGALKEVPSDLLGGHSPRECLIDLGNMYRKFRPSFWVDRVTDQIKSHPKADFMVTDVRYPNEADALKKLGALIVRIERHPDRDHMVDERTKQSGSETAMDNYEGFAYVLPGEKNRVPQDLENFWSGIVEDASHHRQYER